MIRQNVIRLFSSFFILCIIKILLPQDLKSQNYLYFEFENRYTFENTIKIRPQVNVYGKSLKKDKIIGSYFYALANEAWGEAYGGILIRPLNWMIISAGIGVETDSALYRLNWGLYLVNNKLSLSQWYEYGGSGFWYDVQLNYQILNNLKTGIIFKRYYGLGINFLYDIKKTPISINFAPLYDFEVNSYRAMLILRFSF